MSIYWAPDDEPPNATPEASGALARDIAALIYEHDIPWDSALVRRIWASVRNQHGPHPAAAQPVAGFVLDDRPR